MILRAAASARRRLVRRGPGGDLLARVRALRRRIRDGRASVPDWRSRRVCAVLGLFTADQVGQHTPVVPGAAHDVEPRTAIEVLAGAVERVDDQLAATDTAAESTARQRNAQALVEEFAAGVQQVQDARVAAVLDRLTAEGALAETDRVALAADPATVQLGWLLRSAELAGHDVDRVVTDAIGARPLTGARSVAQVLHSRISDDLHGRLTPTADTLTETVPQTGTRWDGYLSQLAEAVDDRRRELGTTVAAEQPQWAVEALGPVPDDPADRLEWEHRAGVVAAHRELTDHNDEAQTIPPARRPA